MSMLMINYSSSINIMLIPVFFLSLKVASGNLLVILSRHYQRVSCLKFTDDGSHFLSSGEDNLVLVWKMARYT